MPLRTDCSRQEVSILMAALFSGSVTEWGPRKPCTFIPSSSIISIQGSWDPKRWGRGVGPIQKGGFIPRLDVFFKTPRKAKPPIIASSTRPLFTQEGQHRAWLMVWTLSRGPGLVLLLFGNRLVVCLRQGKYPLWVFIPSLKMGKKCLCCRAIWRN